MIEYYLIKEKHIYTINSNTVANRIDCREAKASQ
jgi:hypothetical protein